MTAKELCEALRTLHEECVAMRVDKGEVYLGGVQIAHHVFEAARRIEAAMAVQQDHAVNIGRLPETTCVCVGCRMKRILNGETNE